MTRSLVVFYGGLCYQVFLGVFGYSIRFVSDLGVPRSVDNGPPASIPIAVLFNLMLIPGLRPRRDRVHASRPA